MYKCSVGLLLAVFLWGCSSTKLIDQWQSPETPVYAANKVLVVGMTADSELRLLFEDKLSRALEQNGVTAVRSIDFFESAFTNDSRTENDLDTTEDQLLEAGFDAILVSKITGYKNKVTVVHAYRGLTDDFQKFQDYYFTNQDIYRTPQKQDYKIYHSETSVFCICPGEERALRWRGLIDIVDPYYREGNIKDYVRTLIKTLRENDMVIVGR